MIVFPQETDDAGAMYRLGIRLISMANVNRLQLAPDEYEAVKKYLDFFENLEKNPSNVPLMKKSSKGNA